MGGGTDGRFGLVNGPGNAGVLGLVKVGVSFEALKEGKIDSPMIQRPDGEWVKDEELLELILDRGMGVAVASGVELIGDYVWFYSIFAVPRKLLRGREGLVREWVNPEDLPSRQVTFKDPRIYVRKEVLPNGAIRLYYRVLNEDYEE